MIWLKLLLWQKILVAAVVLAILSSGVFFVAQKQKNKTQTSAMESVENGDSALPSVDETNSLVNQESTKTPSSQNKKEETQASTSHESTATSSTESSPSTSSSDSQQSSSSSSPSSSSNSPSTSSNSSSSSTTSGPVIWNHDGLSWKPSNTPPICDSKILLTTPVDLSTVESILYPGQVRGNDYKAHGGFRFNNSSNAVTVKAPYDAVVVNGVRYYENGDLQYMFEFQVNCGIAYRFDHLKTLSSTLQAIADNLPEPKVDDTRTTTINPVSISKNEILATAVGQTNNTSFDWGVYDLRQTNGITKNNNTLASYGVCWFDWIAAADGVIVRGLPATADNKTSDYC